MTEEAAGAKPERIKQSVPGERFLFWDFPAHTAWEVQVMFYAC